MKNRQHLTLDHYEYWICVHSTTGGKYQGVLVVTAHKEEPYIPPLQIPTSSSFDTAHAAEIEASALAAYLINTGAIHACLQRAKSETPLLFLESE